MSDFKANKAVVSWSGGLDSSCLVLTLLAKGMEIRAFGFDYGQKHDIELEKVKKNVEFLQKKGYKITHQVIDLKDAFSDSASSLHKSNKEEIPHDVYNSENQRSTVIENRNVIFSSIIYGKALGWANKTGDNVLISLGLHSNDESVYPDCRPESQEMAKELFRISNWGSEKVDYIAPFIHITKAQVLTKGLEAMKELGWSDEERDYFLSNTHSCYDVNEKGESCGRCGTCQERVNAFYINGLKDPIPYRISDDELLKVAKEFK